jgi:hypothetical protein
MTFLPIVPVWALIVIAVVLVGIRMLALYRLLVRTSGGRYRRVVLRWSGLTLAVLLLVMASARPGLQSDDEHSRTHPTPVASTANLNIFFVVDRSVDSRVDDFAPQTSRMAGVRDDIKGLIDQYPRARFAAIGFASKAELLWPLSDDVWSLKPRIDGLSTYTDVPLEAMYQVNSGAANDLLKTQLERATAAYPNSKNVVFYLGSGAGGSRVAQTAFSPGSGLVVGGAALGYGTAEGGPIPQLYVGGDLVYMADQQTQAPLISTLNEDTLKARAGELGVTYYHREKGQSVSLVAPSITAEPAPGAAAALSGGVTVVASRTIERTELYWLFCVLAAVLILVEITLTTREYRRSRLARRNVTR